jgi:hypothetical protein
MEGEEDGRWCSRENAGLVKERSVECKKVQM